jgi:hypothetical protein
MKFRFLAFFFFLFLICVPLRAQVEKPLGDEASAFSSAARTKDPNERIAALNKFLQQFPNGANAGQARYMLVEAETKLDKKTEALQSAAEYVGTSQSEMSACNDVAWLWAENDFELDSALAYINRGLEIYKKARGRYSASYLDTKTWVLYHMKNYSAALATQKEAVGMFPPGTEWNPQFAEYYYRLGLCMYKTGDTVNGELLLARTALFGFDDALLALKNFLAESHSESQLASIFKKASDDYIARASDADEAKATAAVGLAKQEILLDTAAQYAQQAYNAMPPNAEIQQRITRTVALGIVKFSQKNYDDAIALLTGVRPFASPYETDLFYYLGQSYEAKNELREAFNAYVDGVLAFKAPVIEERLTALLPKVFGENTNLDSLVADEKQKMESFEAGHFQRIKDNDRVVLAELFTGSECNPCLAADAAYDKLLERYGRSELAVLEYHLHIPRPDPMANTNTEARAKFYNVFSTPTSIINGEDKVTGGGPRVASKSAFEEYCAAIEQDIAEPPRAKISLSGALSGNEITLSATAAADGDTSSHIKLFVVLAEDEIHYQGSNTVSVHRFVVRKIAGPLDGVDFTNGSAALNTTLNVAATSDSLKTYLDEFEARVPGGKVFKEKKYEINPANVYLVAFVQNVETKEILQAVVKKL